MNNNLIHIQKLLQQLDNEYIVLKIWPDFPNYLPGSDVDLLVFNRHQSVERLIEYLNQKLDGNDTFVRIHDSGKHLHLDVMKEGKLDIRVDLIDNLDIFHDFGIQDALKTKFFMDRIVKDFDGLPIFVPCKSDDLLIRYIEYLAYFSMRPEKIKHLEFILENSNETEQKAMIANAHRFIQFRHKTWEGDIPARGTNSTLFANSNSETDSRLDALRKIKNNFKYIITVTLRKGFRKK